MSTVSETTTVPYWEQQMEAVFARLREISKELPCSDGIPLESAWHVAAMSLLIDCLSHHLRDRNDFYCGGDMFIYFNIEHSRAKDFRGPDFFVVKGVDKSPPRAAWILWEEGGRYPDFIIELVSASTQKIDRVTKKQVYQDIFRTPEYLLYDPSDDEIEGWRLIGGTYERIEPNEEGRIWSEQLQLWVGRWTGKYLNMEHDTFPRFYDASGNVVLTDAEDAMRHATAETQRADAETQRADAEAQRAQAAARRADEEAKRAQSAEGELARLKELMREKGITPDEA